MPNINELLAGLDARRRAGGIELRNLIASPGETLKRLAGNSLADLSGNARMGLDASQNMGSAIPGLREEALERLLQSMGGLGLVGRVEKVLKPREVKANVGGYDPVKVGLEYPETMPPVLAHDKKSGKEFLQKQNSPEAEAVAKKRKEAQRDIEAGAYEPYFDVEKRIYADPKRYAMPGTTLTEALPKKQATIDKWKAELDTPMARQTLSEAYERGFVDPMTKDWYAVGQLEKEFIKEYGKKDGPRLFKERFADAMAATTGGADPTSNLLMAHYGNYLRANKMPIPEHSYEYPFPIGGRYASGNMEMYDKVINRGVGLGSMTTPKRYNFSGNFLGHRDRATIDEQMSQGFKPGLLAPPGDSYGIMEGVVHELAKKYGVTPAQFQDVTWAGLKGVGGKPMIQHVNEAIERTARVTGKSPEEVVRDHLVRAKYPLYGLGGLGVGLAQQEESNGGL